MPAAVPAVQLVLELPLLPCQVVVSFSCLLEGWEKGRPCSLSTWTRWLEPRPRIKRPLEKWSTQAAAMAMVGALRTKMLVMLVPRRIFRVTRAQAVRRVNWSPPWPSETQADS
jgi:hypothetical protein